MKRKWFRPILIAGAIALGAMLIAAIAFLIASHMANATGLTPEQKAGPAELRLAAGGGKKEIRPAPALSDRELAGVKSYTDYIQARLAKEGANPALALYLEALKRYEAEGIQKAAEKEMLSRAIDDSVTAEQAKFLETHADFIALLHRLAQAGPIPGFKFEELVWLTREKPELKTQEGNLFLLRIAQLLTSEAWRCAETRNYRASRERIQDALSLCEKLPTRPGLLSHLARRICLSNTLSAVRRCLERPQFPTAELQALQPALEHFEKALLTPDALFQALRESLRVERAPVIAAMESGSWRQPEFGWEADRKPQYYWSTFKPWKGRTLRVPRVTAFARDAFWAIHNRLEAPEALLKYDQFYLHEIESARRILNGLPDDASWTTRTEYQSFMLESGPTMGIQELHKATVSVNYQRQLTSTADMHLCRVGLGLRVDDKAMLARRGEDLRNDPFHPWRDPFTGKALIVIQTTTQTTVYSVGEDRIDQGGDGEKNDDQAIRIAR